MQIINSQPNREASTVSENNSVSVNGTVSDNSGTVSDNKKAVSSNETAV